MRGNRVGYRFASKASWRHRKRERALIGEYEALIDHILANPGPKNHAQAVELASVHGAIRGYDVVKEASMAAAAQRLAEAKTAFAERSGGSGGQGSDALRQNNDAPQVSIAGT